MGKSMANSLANNLRPVSELCHHSGELFQNVLTVGIGVQIASVTNEP